MEWSQPWGLYNPTEQTVSGRQILLYFALNMQAF